MVGTVQLFHSAGDRDFRIMVGVVGEVIEYLTNPT
jgi:hypothetical protein